MAVPSSDCKKLACLGSYRTSCSVVSAGLVAFLFRFDCHFRVRKCSQVYYYKHTSPVHHIQGVHPNQCDNSCRPSRRARKILKKRSGGRGLETRLQPAWWRRSIFKDRRTGWTITIHVHTSSLHSSHTQSTVVARVRCNSAAWWPHDKTEREQEIG